MQRADIFRARPTHLGPVSQRIWTPLRGFGPRNKTE